MFKSFKQAAAPGDVVTDKPNQTSSPGFFDDPEPVAPAPSPTAPKPSLIDRLLRREPEPQYSPEALRLLELLDALSDSALTTYSRQRLQNILAMRTRQHPQAAEELGLIRRENRGEELPQMPEPFNKGFHG